MTDAAVTSETEPPPWPSAEKPLAGRKIISLSELADYPLVIPGRPHANRMTVEHALSNIGKKIQIAHEVECIQAIVDLVRQRHV